MPEIKIEAVADVQPAVKGLEQVQQELIQTATAAKTINPAMASVQASLAKTAIAANALTKTSSGLEKSLTDVGKSSAPQLDKLSNAIQGVEGVSDDTKDAVSGLIDGFKEGGAQGLIMAAVSATITIGLSALTEALFGASDAEKEFAEQSNRIQESYGGAQGAYTKAVEQVENLRIAFKEAETGVISQNAAVKLYNDTIGKVTGSVNTLAEAELGLAKKGDAYIKFTLLKAAANVALGKASEQLFNAQLKDAELIRFNKSREGIAFGGNNYTDISNKLTQEKIKFESEADKFIGIQKDFITQSEEIAKGFNFTGKGEKDVSGIIGKIQSKIKELQDLQPGLLSEKAITENVLQIKKLQDELDRLLGKIKSVKDVKSISDVLKELRLELDNLSTREIQLGTNEAKGKLSALDGAIKELVTKFGQPGKNAALQLYVEVREIQLKEALQKTLETSVKGQPIKIEPVLILDPVIKNGGWMQAIFDELDRKKKLFEQKLASFQAAVGETVTNIGADAASSLGEVLGAALSGNIGGINGIFDELFSSIGSQIQQLGKFLIKSGIQIQIAKKAFAKLLASPLASIAVGIGLVAFGALIKNAIGGKPKGFATGVRNFQPDGQVVNVGERGPERIFLPRGASVQPNNELQAYGASNSGYIAETRIQGQELVLLIKRAEATMSRNG